MAKRGGGFGGAMPGNMGQLMKQAQKMQAQIAEQQEQIKTMEFEASAGGGVVSVTVNGNKEITKVEIDPDAVDPEDVEMLEDLVVAAVSEAIRKADEMANTEMGKLTGGINFPGF